MNLNHPVHQSWSNSLVYFDLFTHIHWVCVPFSFSFKHIIMNVIYKLSHMVNIPNSVFICLMNLTQYLFFTSLVEHLQLLVKADAWQFISRRCSVGRAGSLGVLWVACGLLPPMWISHSTHSTHTKPKWLHRKLRHRSIWRLSWWAKSFVILWFGRSETVTGGARSWSICITWATKAMCLLRWRSDNWCMIWVFNHSTINIVSYLRWYSSCVFDWRCSLTGSHSIIWEFVVSRRNHFLDVSSCVWFL